MKKQNTWFAVILIICALIISGCIEEETLSNVMGDPVLRRAEPYITSCPKTNSHYTIQSFFISIRQLLIVI